jgi:DNA-binding MltR family transcriptional regulator
MDAEFLDMITKESDRGCVLLAASLIDEGLKSVLQRTFVNDPHVQKEAVTPLLDGPLAPLGSFAARTYCAYALGLIDRAKFETLIVLRKIRNEFAHRVAPVDLTDERVAKLIEKMVLPVELKECIEQMANHYTSASNNLQPKELIQLTRIPGMSPNRIVFTTAVALLNAKLVSASNNRATSGGEAPI